MKEFRTQFDLALKQWFVEKKQSFSACVQQDLLLEELFTAIEALSLSGGKRIRPSLVWLLSGFSLPLSAKQLRPFIAIELFHVFGLIHDDIIDNGESRRGVPTTHIVAEKFFDTHNKLGLRKKYGESMALLMGDLLFAWVHELLDTADLAPENLQRVKSMFTRMSEDVMIGQLIDVDIMSSESTSSERIFQKMKLKTASYTFVWPMQIGLALGNAESILFEESAKCGELLGIAFQIQDDILDAMADEALLGKTPMRDITEGQHTLLTQYIFEQGTAEQKQTLKQFFRTELSDAQKIELRELFEHSGALQFAEKQVDHYFEMAKNSIAASHFDENIKKELYLLVQEIEKRKK
jgi:geranylgeranyl diphosphate synthase type I